MLAIRLKRVGRRNQPAFRVVVVEKTRGPKSNDVVDTIGFYDPFTKQKDLKADKAGRWIAQGAQPSDRVYNMLVDAGVVAGKKRNVLPKKSPIVKERSPEEAVATPGVEGGKETPKSESAAEPATAKGAEAAEEVPEIVESEAAEPETRGASAEAA